MEQRAGAFIVIEGSDGSGKATQLKLIRERLEAAGHQVETFDFPQYDKPSSYFVQRYLNGDYGTTDQVGPYTSSLFYALDRFEAAASIRAALDAGKIVISNRFTGSNMAHQGTKIANAEQRRGFFIWLDNLEFEMLRIPRPDISFVLRVPAEVSQALLTTRENLDIHEADITHLERTVAVYDDMTQLFPKDFQRIDCVRSGQLLDIQTVNMMLWEKISPLLPAPAPAPEASNEKETAAPAPAPAEAATVVEEITAEETQEAPSEHLVLADASGLLIERIERIATTTKAEYPKVAAAHTPLKLVPDAQKLYETKTAALLRLQAKLITGLTKQGHKPAKARQTAMPALMVAATANIQLNADDPNLQTLIVALINDDLPEAQAAGASLFAQAIAINPNQFKGSDTRIKRTAASKISTIADEFLSQNTISDQPPVQLTSVWPRNENDLIADMLYGYTGLPLRTIQDRIASWPLSRKLEVFEAYITDPQPGSALEKAHYSWDILAPYGAFCTLQKQPSEALEIQTLTPRFGYDIPQAIEDAGLADTYEKCFDLSLELYSILQNAGHHLEAQYATLYGHNQRWKMTQNAAQTIALLQARHDPQTKNLLAELHEKLSEAHPTIAETIERA